jgi:hypothetical protein
MEGILMKRRLFAAAMAMTMVMGSSMAVTASTDISDSTSNAEQKTNDVGVYATVSPLQDYNTGGYSVSSNDASSRVWNIHFSADEVVYQLSKQRTVNTHGSYSVVWDPTTKQYVATWGTGDNAPGQTYSYDYWLTEAESNTATKTVAITNNSNFSVGASAAEQTDTYNILTVDTNSLGTLTNTNATSDTQAFSVTLDIDGDRKVGIPSYENLNTDKPSLGTVRVTLAAGAPTSYTEGAPALQ